MAANPRMLNATQTKDAFGFDKNWYIVKGFNPAEDVLDIIGTAYAVEINDAENGIGGTLILKDKPASTEENLTTKQILSLDGIFLQGVPAARISAINVRQGGTLESLANPDDILIGNAIFEAAPTTTTVVEQPTQNTGSLITNNGNTVIEQPQRTSGTGTIIQQSPATITQTPTIIAGNGFTTNSVNTAEKVKILDGKGIFGTPGSDLGQFSDNGSTGNAQNTTRVVNALGGNNILSISTPGTYIGGAGDDVFNVETAPGVINIMAGRGADTVAISGGATTNNHSPLKTHHLFETETIENPAKPNGVISRRIESSPRNHQSRLNFVFRFKPGCTKIAADTLQESQNQTFRRDAAMWGQTTDSNSLACY
ncbi:MAG: hypothetical protein ACK5XX_05345 [Holosporales bacterium]